MHLKKKKEDIIGNGYTEHGDITGCNHISNSVLSLFFKFAQGMYQFYPSG